MSVLTDRALTAMNAIKGGAPLSGARAVEVATDFINNDTLTNDETAQLFLDTLRNIVKSTVQSHRQQAAAALNDAAEVQAGLDAVTDL